MNETLVRFPETKEILEYLQAFYHGLPVRTLTSHKLQVVADFEEDDPASSKGKAKAKAKNSGKAPTLWLNTNSSSGCIGIRTRSTSEGTFSHQLNLNDLLDAAIEILPDDAYALLMLVQHDIYEDDEDDFACGRAYGSSRIAVVSGVRYNPVLDHQQHIDRVHGWPASHFIEYMSSCCIASDGGKPKTSKSIMGRTSKGVENKSPIQAALEAHLSLPSLSGPPSSATLLGLWLGRVCRTASHELGHCFGIDHCVCYACAMQGTTSVIEDARQPPYLCPIDLAKVLKASGAEERERYEALLAFCEKHMEAHIFRAFGCWIRGRLGIAG